MRNVYAACGTNNSVEFLSLKSSNYTIGMFHAFFVSSHWILIDFSNPQLPNELVISIRFLIYPHPTGFQTLVRCAVFWSRFIIVSSFHTKPKVITQSKSSPEFFIFKRHSIEMIKQFYHIFSRIAALLSST